MISYLSNDFYHFHTAQSSFILLKKTIMSVHYDLAHERIFRLTTLSAKNGQLFCTLISL